jgi:C3HC zinc finger-like
VNGLDCVSVAIERLVFFEKKKKMTSVAHHQNIEMQSSSSPSLKRMARCRPWSMSDYSKRVASYTSMRWSARPRKESERNFFHVLKTFSALECARFGWRCIDANMLECTSCRSRLMAPSAAASLSSFALASLPLIDAHKIHCPWRTLSCSALFVRTVGPLVCPPTKHENDDEKNDEDAYLSTFSDRVLGERAIRAFYERLDSLRLKCSALLLPKFDRDALAGLHSLERLERCVEQRHVPFAWLALCGWQTVCESAGDVVPVAERNQTVFCALCRRVCVFRSFESQRTVASSSSPSSSRASLTSTTATTMTARAERRVSMASAQSLLPSGALPFGQSASHSAWQMADDDARLTFSSGRDLSLAHIRSPFVIGEPPAKRQRRQRDDEAMPSSSSSDGEPTTSIYERLCRLAPGGGAKPLFHVVNEHRDFCPWTKTSSLLDANSEHADLRSAGYVFLCSLLLASIND